MGSVPLVRCLPKMSPSSSTYHLEAIFCMNTSRLRLDLRDSDHRRRERCSSDHRHFSLNPAQYDSLLHRQSQLSDLTIRLYTTSLKSISQKHQMFKRSSDQFNYLDANLVTSHSSFSLVNRLTADIVHYDDHKYVNVHRHQLFIFSEINNGESMTVTVL